MRFSLTGIQTENETFAFTESLIITEPPDQIELIKFDRREKESEFTVEEQLPGDRNAKRVASMIYYDTTEERPLLEIQEDQVLFLFFMSKGRQQEDMVHPKYT